MQTLPILACRNNKRSDGGDDREKEEAKVRPERVNIQEKMVWFHALVHISLVHVCSSVEAHGLALSADRLL